MLWISDKLFDICGTNGFYVECGANDGITQSNTYRLEIEKDWTGILIDASVSAMDKCRSLRNSKNIFINKALTSFELANTEIRGNFDGGLMGKIESHGTIVSATTLTDVLKEHNVFKVDLFSLDVEGHEKEVLLGLDFDYCTPELVIVEVWNHERDIIENIMLSHGYMPGENFSQFNKRDNPSWNGEHNDYLYRRKRS